MPVAGTQVIAHRGLHAVGGAPENSLTAFDAAICIGADVLELDVRRTRDGVLVVHHDPQLADGRRIAETDLAALPLVGGQPIPTLAEVADLARTRGARLAVELKEPGYEREVVAQLATRVPLAQVELISFDRGSIRAIESIDRSIVTGLLEPHMPKWMRNGPIYDAARWVMDRLDWHPSITAAAKVGADYVSVEHRLATERFLDAARERNMGVDVWTVDEPRRMAELLDEGVRGIVTDRPDIALGLRDGARTQAAAGVLEIAS